MPTADCAELKRVLMGLTRGGHVPDGGADSVGRAEERSPSGLTTHAQSCLPQEVAERAARWRAEFMPRKMNAEYKREWDLFLVLEVGFFFPFRHGMSSVQANRAQIGVLLADRDHIASVIADGNQQKAASYLTPEYEEFWRSVVPNEEAVPEKTVTSRINRAIRLLASAPNGEAEPVLSSNPVTPVALLSGTTQVQLTFHHETALSSYLQYALPEEPHLVPDAWRSICPRGHLARFTIIRGRTGTGKTHLMKWLAHEFRRQGATPLYLDLPSYANRADEADVLVHISTYGPFANRFRDAKLTADLQRELAQEERQGALVVLADCPDELFDSELPIVASRLASLSHVVLAERSDILPIDLYGKAHLDMPTMPHNQIDALLKTAAGPTGLPFEVMDEFRYHSLAGNLGLLVAAAQLPPDLGCSRRVRLSVERWIDQRLRTTRQVGGQTSELFAARKLLDVLASIDVGLEGPGDGNKGFSARRIEYALRRLEAWAPLGRSPQVLAYLRRTGIVNSTESAHIFSYPELARLIVPRTLPGV